MRYLAALALFLLTTQAFVMVAQGLISLHSDYAVVPLFVEHLIEMHGAEGYFCQLMAEHKSLLRSVEPGAALLLGCGSAWKWWYRKSLSTDVSS